MQELIYYQCSAFGFFMKRAKFICTKILENFEKNFNDFQLFVNFAAI